MSLKESNSPFYPKDRTLECPVCGAGPSSAQTVFWSRESPHTLCQRCLLAGAAYGAKLALKEKEEQERQRNDATAKF